MIAMISRGPGKCLWRRFVGFARTGRRRRLHPRNPAVLYVVGRSSPMSHFGNGGRLAVRLSSLSWLPLSLAGHCREEKRRWRCAVIFAVVGTLGAFADRARPKASSGDAIQAPVSVGSL